MEDRLSDALLAKEFNDGDAVLVDVNEDKEIVLPAPAEPVLPAV